MQRQSTKKAAPAPKSSTSRWEQLREPFGNVLHKRFPLGSKMPEDVDQELIQPGADDSFLNDEIKMLLGLPVNLKPHMALGAPDRVVSFVSTGVKLASIATDSALSMVDWHSMTRCNDGL